MRIEVVGVHLDVTPALAQYVTHRIEQSLDRFEDRILDINVRLEDVSGPHGPGTKRCHLEVHLAHRDTVIVEQKHSDIYTAVDKAGARLKRTVRRQINRIRDARRAHREPVRTVWAQA